MTHSIEWPHFLDQLLSRHASPLAFAFSWWRYNAPLLDRIRETIPPGARVLEVGTGTGALAVLLAAHGYSVLGIDKDPRVVEAARLFADVFPVKPMFEVADGFDLGKYRDRFDLAFSAGVIEHFSPEEGIRLLIQQGACAKYVVCVVPTWYALRNDPETEASNARPIKLRELKILFSRSRLRVLRVFGYGAPDGSFSFLYHYALPRPAQWLLQNRLSYAATIGCIGQRPEQSALSDG